jgi:hypothetical protein
LNKKKPVQTVDRKAISHERAKDWVPINIKFNK